MLAISFPPIAYTRLPAAARFLESQPLTGVLADRHLTQTGRLPAEWLETNRKELTQSRPDWILDGLGTYNPTLAITAFPDLQGWLSDYKEVQRTTNMVIYARQSNR